MADAKVDVKIGDIIFSGEGDSKWLSEQLDKIISNAAKLAAIGTATSPSPKTHIDPSIASKTPHEGKQTLAAFLSQKAPGKNQVRKFLATAEWLTISGKQRMTTSDVSTALSSHHQGKLNNPAECLNQNARKGHCVKEGKEFYVTPDGHNSLSGAD